MNINKIFNLIMALIFALWLVGTPSFVLAQGPAPSLSVYMGMDKVQAHNWPIGIPVTLTIDDPETSRNPDYISTQTISEHPAGSEPTFTVFSVGEVIDIKPGFSVTMTGNGITKETTVVDLANTNVDLETDIVTGTFGPDINLQICADWFSWRNVQTASDGTWAADFSQLGDIIGHDYIVDIKAGVWLCVQWWDTDGDTSVYDWQIPSLPQPEFMLNIDNSSSWDEVTAWNWPLGSQVTLTVDDPNTSPNPDYTEVQTMGPRSGGYSTGASYLQGNNFEGHPGFKITLSDGIQTKSMIVPLLQGTEYDVEADTVSGITNPFASVVVACDVGAEPTMIADSEGNWTANFRDPENPDVVIYDIKPGAWCEPQMYDDDGDHIVLRDWYVPNPYIQGSAQANWVLANGWMEGTIVHLTINSVPYDSAVMGPASWNPNRIVGAFDLAGYDIQVGDVITVEGSGMTKTLTVSAIHITNVDPVANTVSGQASAGADVYVRGSPGGDWVERWVTASDPGGVWSVDFTPDYDLVPGSNGFAQEYDKDGDATLVDWEVPFDIDVDGTPDLLDPCPDDATDICDQASSVAGVIGVDGGVLATENDKVTLNIPPDSLGNDVTLSITDRGGGYELASDQGPMLIIHSYSIQPHGTHFDPPASITFRWEDANDDGIVDGMTAPESNLRLIKDGLVIVPACSANPNCDMTTNELTVQVTNLSLFALAVPMEWTLKGFYQPVDMNGVYNIVKGGSTVPLKFEIFSGSIELTDTAYIQSLTYAQTACDANVITDEIETITIGGTGLRYDVTSGQFIYNWKTPKTAGQCYLMTMTTMDDSSLAAFFKLK